MYKKYLNRKPKLPGLGCILLLLLLQVNASSFAQQNKISLSGTNMPLRELFKEIKKQTGISVIVTTNMLKIANPVNIKVTNADLTDVLNYVFASQPLTYTFHKKSIVIKLKDQGVKTFDKTMPKMSYKTDIHGKVTDGRLLPLPGVSVILEGTGVRTVTDQDGNFALQGIPEEGVLSFSYIGYEKQIIPVQGIKEFSVIMKIHVEELKEVAVVSTGYQNIEKERATGSFSKPDMKLFNNRQGTTDVIAKLEGLVPGLLIRTGPNSSISSGAINTGNATRKSTIRGESSVSLPTDPLYVVNGVPVKNINLFNPDDIAEITVLKDAAASAIWGAQASNGVIVITTKSAEKNGKLSISYSGSFNFQGKPDYSYGKMMNSAQFIQTAKEIFDPITFPYASLSNSIIAPHEQILYDQFAKYGNRNLDAGALHSLDSLAGINNIDQVRGLWNRNGLVQTHTVSISGGTNTYSFYTSAAFTDSRSSTIGQGDRNYRVTLNQDYHPGKRLKLSLNTTLGRRYVKEANPITITNEFLPYQLFADAAGNSLSMPYLMSLSPELRSLYQDQSGINLDYNPLNELNYRSVNVSSTHINVAGSVKLTLFKGLSFNGNYGFQLAPGQRTRYTDHKELELRKNLIGYTVASTAGSAPQYYMPTNGGTYEELNYEERNWTLRNQLVYATSLRSGRDRLNLQLGQEARESLARSTANNVYGYDQALQTYPQLNWGAFIPNTITGGSRVPDAPGPVFYENQSRFTSYFALFNYNISDKYSIDASWRVDHSALFGSDKSAQNRPIWSIGGRWNAHKEDFMSKISWLNALSLRATYGITGNSPFAGNATQWDILSKGFFMNTPLAGPFVTVQPKNAKLSWESTATTNIGVDFSVLNSRLTASVDVYWKKTTDLLGEILLNNLTGFKNSGGILVI